jgi:hypothetical protein
MEIAHRIGFSTAVAAGQSVGLGPETRTILSEKAITYQLFFG